jgi:hypothetical protein
MEHSFTSGLLLLSHNLGPTGLLSVCYPDQQQNAATHRMLLKELNSSEHGGKPG